MSLPVASVPTVGDAKALQVLMCSLAWDGRYVLPGFAERNADVVGSLKWAAAQIGTAAARLKIETVAA